MHKVRGRHGYPTPNVEVEARDCACAHRTLGRLHIPEEDIDKSSFEKGREDFEKFERGTTSLRRPGNVPP